MDSNDFLIVYNDIKNMSAEEMTNWFRARIDGESVENEDQKEDDEDEDDDDVMTVCI